MLNFIRNATLAIAAMAVMIVTLTIVLFSLVANATFTNTIQQITNKIDISVFLNDEVTPAQKDKLVSGIKALPNVKEVTYLSKDEARQKYVKENPDRASIINAASAVANPIPATISIKPVDLNKLDDIKAFLTTSENKALQTEKSP
jgi:cell division transport system permease protein